MTSQHRKHRGYKTQDIVAQYLKQNGWLFAESTGAGRQGSDITGTPAIDWEIKARANFDPIGAMKQSMSRVKEGVIPIAVLRPNGLGEASVEKFACVVPLSVMVQLLKEAGYAPNA